MKFGSPSETLFITKNRELGRESGVGEERARYIADNPHFKAHPLRPLRRAGTRSHPGRAWRDVGQMCATVGQVSHQPERDSAQHSLDANKSPRYRRDLDLILANPDGSPLMPTSVRQRCRRWRLGLPAHGSVTPRPASEPLGPPGWRIAWTLRRFRAPRPLVGANDRRHLQSRDPGLLHRPQCGPA
jgi:hypothetical protein